MEERYKLHRKIARLKDLVSTLTFFVDNIIHQLIPWKYVGHYVDYRKILSVYMIVICLNLYNCLVRVGVDDFLFVRKQSLLV